MEDWHDLIDPTIGVFPFALAFGLAISLFAFLVIRLIHLRPKVRNQHSWRNDLRPSAIVGAASFSLVFIPSVLIGCFLSGGCGTGDITEVPSPDGKHKIVVYNFDCGATTDFSLDVSLLKRNEKLGKHHPAKIIYHHYHQRPMAAGPQQNFDISWQNSNEVVVRVSGFEGHPTTQSQDGVTVRVEQLP
jgi:hypothetical protein